MSQTQQHVEISNDRRRFQRSAVLWEAAILQDDHADACVLLNVSEGGALLRVLDPFACATTLNLEIARVGQIDAKVAWRGADAVGIVFQGDPGEVARRFEAYRIRFGLGGFFFDGFSAKLADVNVPVHAGKYLRDMLPHTRVTLLPGEGHFFLLKRWEEVLAALVYGK